MRKSISVLSLVVLIGIFSLNSLAETKKEVKKMNKSTEEQVVKTASGLQYVDHVIGNGISPKAGQKIQVHYTGWLQSDMSKFDSSVDRGQPFEFVVGIGQVIKGWDEGVITMMIGGKRTLIIPPDLGYGAKGAGTAIPPNSILVFDVELLGVKEE